MYKIFINNKPLYLSDLMATIVVNGPEISMEVKHPEELLKAVLSFENDTNIKALQITHKNVEELWQNFQSIYKRMEAAGGVVMNGKGNTLFIKRFGKWDLPKGKMEMNENTQETAIREVQEECGITDLTIEKQLRPTYHTYNYSGGRILKKTDWFKMIYNGTTTPTPQKAEGITAVQWFQNIEEPLKNTYRSIIDVFSNLQID